MNERTRCPCGLPPYHYRRNIDSSQLELYWLYGGLRALNFDVTYLKPIVTFNMT